MPPDPAVRDLATLDVADEPAFGGKACGLARLIAAGARVPPGLAIAATAGPPPGWPDDLRRELLARAATLLSNGPVAVRSSAPGEDGATRSFAGLFETVLGVRDAEALLAAAERCMRSGASERVRAYAGTASTDGLPRPVGLVVQQQVDAEAAGVCFTVDPAGRDGGVMLEAVTGTGDALVSGHAQPESWRVYRSGLGTWEAHRDPGRPGRVLAQARAASIAEQARGLADRFGHPLDLEWAIDRAGTLFWLQARPVTAAAPVQEIDVERCFTLVDDGPVTVWANWNVREVMPEPFTPLNWSLWRDVVLPMVIEDAFGVRRSSALFPHTAGIDLVGGRIYWNMNAVLGGPMGPIFSAALGHLDARAAEVTRGLVDAGVLRPRRVPVSRWRLLAPLAWSALRSTLRMGGSLRPRHALRVLEESGRRMAARPAVSLLDDAGLLREMELLGAPECRPFRHAMQLLTAAFLVHATAERVFRPHPRARRLLTAGIEDNPTTRVSLDVDELAEAAGPLRALFEQTLTTPELLERLGETAEGAAWRARLDEVLGRCGQRCPNEFDIATPRWAEDPTLILDLVRAALRAPAGERARARIARLAAERGQAVAEAAAAAPWWWRPVLRRTARLAASYAPLREAPKHYTMHVFRRMRQAALEIGARLEARGVLETRDDVMFLDRAEVEAALEGRAPPSLPVLVSERRARHRLHLAARAPHFVRSDGVPVVEAAVEPAADGSLRGVGASAGSATGPVRVLRAPDPRSMADGDVIVVELADPGWTPLFPRAAAVVMEVGGTMCHAAVVARELGVPAVFGVAEATSRLHDGQRVRVDGDLGLVTPVQAGRP